MNGSQRTATPPSSRGQFPQAPRGRKRDPRCGCSHIVLERRKPGSGVSLHSSLRGLKLVIHADTSFKGQVDAVVLERNEQHREHEEAWVLVLSLSLNNHVMLSKSFQLNYTSAVRGFGQYELKVLAVGSPDYISLALIKIYFKAEGLKLKK